MQQSDGAAEQDVLGRPDDGGDAAAAGDTAAAAGDEQQQEVAKVDNLVAKVDGPRNDVDLLTATLDGLGARVDESLPGPPPLLPTELLLLVLERLDEESLLLGARGVCRQWRDAVRHPSLWRSRGVSSNYEKLCQLKLSTAPCLQYCELYAEDPRRQLDLRGLRACAIEALSLFLQEANERGMQNAALLLEDQVELGRLKKVFLEDLPVQGAARLLWAVRSAGLEELRITFSNRTDDSPVMLWDSPMDVSDSKSASTLKSLTYTSFTPDPVLEDLLRLHSATLQSVDLQICYSECALQLLGSCPQLQYACVPGEAGAASLRSCPLLRKLDVFLVDQAPPELVSFFREAVELTELGMYNVREGGIDGSSVMDCLRALGSSRRSKLQVLAVLLNYVEVDLLSLPVAMEGLRLLHTLKLSRQPPMETLTAITPATAPSLRYFQLRYRVSDGLCSDDGWQCYFAAVLDLVRRNRGLHVTSVRSVHNPEGCVKEFCACCEQGAHELARGIQWLEGVCGHARDVQCGVVMPDTSPVSCYKSDHWLYL